MRIYKGATRRRTVVLEVIGDGRPPVRAPCQREQLGDLVGGGGARGEDGPRELGEARADGADGEVLRGDVEIFFLVLEELRRASALL